MGADGERRARRYDQQFTFAKTLNGSRDLTPPVTSKAEHKERLLHTARAPAKRTRRMGEESRSSDKQRCQKRMFQLNSSHFREDYNLLRQA